jgi:hypothetical protein
MTATQTVSAPETAPVANALGYQSFAIGHSATNTSRNIHYPGNQHIMPIGAFPRALMRDVGWGFSYGTVNFDHVFGTLNHYGTVDMFIGLFNDAYRKANRHLVKPSSRWT